MALAPLYRPDVVKRLDEIEVGDNERLWNAIVDTLTMICDDSDDGTGKAYRIRSHRGDTAVWAVRVPCVDPDDWYVLWDEDVDPVDKTPAAVFFYIGPLPNGMPRR
jgi:hypothetical protein